jgi:transketolase
MFDEPRAADGVAEAQGVDSRELARRIRVHVLRMVHHANASHVGTCFSLADILAVLYSGVLNIEPGRPDHPNRDRFVLSKGHGAAALYAVLAETGFFPSRWLENYCDDLSPLAGHASHRDVPGVEVSTGALGHGLSLGCGMALAGRSSTDPYCAFVALSDGELNEGAIWEAAMFAGHHKLSNLTAIVDANGLQGFGSVVDVLNLEPLAQKWEASGWRVSEVDGHDHMALYDALTSSGTSVDRPHVVLARTIKGKGVSFMENKLEWHYRSPNDEQLAAALLEIGGAS